MNELQTPDGRSLPSLDQVVEQAAFLGSFDPAGLLPPPDLTGDYALFGGLAEKCVEVPVEDGFQWVLRTDARTDAFVRLARERRLQDVARAALGSPYLGELGHMLVQLVTAPMPEPATLSAAELDRLRVACGLLGTAVHTASPHVINHEIERRSIDQGLAQLRSSQLIGREEELDDILAWLRAPLRRSGISDEQQKFFMMAVTGMGGVGKSALLAELVMRLRNPDWSGQPVVWLDFDHPARVRLDPTSVMEDLLRQLALHPMFDDDITQQYRDSLSEVSSEDTHYRSLESASSAASERGSLWSAVLSESNIEGLRLLVICDTFEELLGRGEDERRQLIQLLRGLSQTWNIDSVHVICAGRALESNAYWKPDRSMTLDALSSGQAAQLFWRTANLAPGEQLPVAALIDKFGGNPLVIKLLARQARADSSILTALLTEDVPLDVDSEFVQGFLYTRILKRIRTDQPAVRQLAYPGLALRRVSPLLIQDVLAGACKLGTLTVDESHALFRELSRQFWLVEATSDPLVVLHRKDLRRLMLLSMDTAHADAIRDIHRAAIAFYESHRDPALSAEEQQLEADYHRLLLGESAAVDTAYALRLLEATGLDLACVPVGARAVLKLHAGRELSDTETATLQTGDLYLHYATVRERQSATGQVLARQDPFTGAQQAVAGAVWPSAAGATAGVFAEYSPGLSRRTARDIDPAGIHEAFSRREFAWLSEIACEVAESTLMHGSTLGLSREGRTLTESPLWQVGIAVMLEGREDEMRKLLSDALVDPHAMREERWNRYASTSIAFAQGIAATLRLLAPTAPLPDLEDDGFQSTRTEQVSTHETLRAWQLLGYANKGRQAEIRLHVLNYMDEVFRSGESLAHMGIRFDSTKWDVSLDAARKRGTDGPRIAALQRLATGMAPLRIDPAPSAGSAWRCALSGPAAELYPLLRVALGALPQESLRGLCMELTSGASGQWPRELRWDTLSETLTQARDQWLATFVEYADRYGRLEYLAEYVARHGADQASVVGLDVWQIVTRFKRRIEEPLSQRFAEKTVSSRTMRN